MFYSLSQIKEIPEATGVYLFLDKRKKILYIGKAINLKKRISTYFYQKKHEVKVEKLISKVDSIQTITVNSEFDALLLEAKLIKQNQPKYNSIWKDDKHYLYIKISKEKFPKILLSRRNDDKTAIYYGPYPSSKIAKELLYMIRRIIPFCSQKKIESKACFYTHLNLCNPCPADIIKLSGRKYKDKFNTYQRNIKKIKLILSGKSDKLTSYLKKQMMFLARQKKFEQAIIIREKLKELEFLTKNYHSRADFMESKDYLNNIRQEENRELVEILNKYYPSQKELNKIECYDISNISGKFSAGSMITFISGLPEKKFYRRFLIKTVEKSNDPAMLKEILRRRLNHPEWEYPDLIVVDGGKSQLLAIKKACREFNLSIPCLGIAKKLEELVILKDNKCLKIKPAKDSKALHLIQRLRDEAHRFAHQYHEKLRIKYLFTEFEKKNVSC